MTSFSENDDLPAVWAQALDRYQQITGISLQKPGERGFDVITRDINKELERHKSGRGAKAKEVMGNVMKCLQQFGSIVAQATTVVFGPSAQCWNAISFVISAAQAYQGILDGFVTLMDRSVAFLQRLNVYLSDKRGDGTFLHPLLRDAAYKVLDHFLTVLANSYNLTRSKWEKTKTVFKIVLFNDDAGVASALAQMEWLIQGMTDTTVAVILKEVEGLAKYMTSSHEELMGHQSEILHHMKSTEATVEHTETVVRLMKEEQIRQTAESNAKKTLDKIRKNLKLSEIDTWEGQQHEIVRSRVLGTGQWLLDYDTFQSWAEICANPAFNAWLVSGKESSGKSYLSSHVIDYLRKKYAPRRAKDRVAVAYYYFRRGVANESVERCLGSIVYQFAASDPEYAKAALSVCEGTDSLARACDLWKHLVSDLLGYMKGAYFIVIDGFNECDGGSSVSETMGSIIDRAMENGQQPLFRIFLTARESNMATVPLASSPPHQVLGRSRPEYQTIKRKPTPGQIVNRADLEAVARARIEDICHYDEDLRSIVQRLYSDIAAELVKRISGDYQLLQIRLDQISAATSEEDVKNVISRADQGRSQSIRSTIAALDQTLDAGDVEVLNRLLVWVTADLRSTCLTDVNVLQAALQLEIGSKILLRKAIQTKFSAILKLESSDPPNNEIGRNMMRPIYDDFRENRIQVNMVRPVSDDLRDIMSSPTENTTAVEEWKISTVQNVVKAFCGDRLYAQLGFETFFTTRRSGEMSRIRVPDNNTAHVDILSTCLRALCEKNDVLQRHAFSLFGDLLPNIDIDKANKDVLRQIGSRIAHFLGDSSIILFAWDEYTLQYLLDQDRGQHGFLNTLEKLVRHDAVAAGYEGDAETFMWLRTVASGQDENESIFSRVAGSWTDRWLGHEKEGPLYFEGAYRLMAPTWYAGQYNTQEVPNVEQINRLTKWAAARTKIEINPATLERRKGEIFQKYRHSKAETTQKRLYAQEAIAAFERAAQELTQDWRLLSRIVSEYIGWPHQDYRRALEFIRKFKELNGRSMENNQDYRASYWRRNRWREIQCYCALDDTESAEKCLTEMLDHGEEDDPEADREMRAIGLDPKKYVKDERYNHDARAVNQVFDHWNERREYENMMSLVQKWKSTDASGENLRRWLLRMPLSGSFHVCISSAAAKLGKYETLSNMYRQVLEKETPCGSANQTVTLEHFCGAIMFHSTSQEEQGIALATFENLVRRFARDVYFDEWIVRRSVNTLARYLVEKAILQGPGSDSGAAFPYTSKLEELCELDLTPPYIVPGRLYDPRVSLARLRVLQKECNRGRATLKEVFRSTLSDSSNSKNHEEAARRITRLACILTIVDDDINARAAWFLLQKDHLKNQALHCDGSVYPKHRIHEQFYVCKDCPSTVLCPGCYKRLQNGDMNPLICNKIHAFLDVPSLDRSKEKEMPSDMVIVGESWVPLEEWLNELRKDWNVLPGLTQEYMVTRVAQYGAVQSVSKWRKAVLRKRQQRGH